MEIGDIKIPDEMLEAADNEFFQAASLNGIPNATDGQRLSFALAAAIRWLRGKILHPTNVEFHRAILNAERDYYPGSDQDGAVVARRIDFESGVSFARNYLRSMFDAELSAHAKVQFTASPVPRPVSTLEPIPPIPDLTAIARLYLENYVALTDEDRKIYRKLIWELMSPPLIMSNFDAAERDKAEP